LFLLVNTPPSLRATSPTEEELTLPLQGGVPYNGEGVALQGRASPPLFIILPTRYDLRELLYVRCKTSSELGFTHLTSTFLPFTT
jgi:hypothetical protein